MENKQVGVGENEQQASRFPHRQQQFLTDKYPGQGESSRQAAAPPEDSPYPVPV
jgi:hypothetical protein